MLNKRIHIEKQVVDEVGFGWRNSQRDLICFEWQCLEKRPLLDFSLSSPNLWCDYVVLLCWNPKINVFQLAWWNSNIAYHPMHPRHSDYWKSHLVGVVVVMVACSLHAHFFSWWFDSPPRSVHRQLLPESPNVGRAREEVSSAFFDTQWRP